MKYVTGVVLCIGVVITEVRNGRERLAASAHLLVPRLLSSRVHHSSPRFGTPRRVARHGRPARAPLRPRAPIARFALEVDLDLDTEIERLNGDMDKHDCVNLFLSEGAGMDAIIREKEAAGEEVRRDAFGHARLDELNPGKWFASKLKERLMAGGMTAAEVTDALSQFKSASSIFVASAGAGDARAAGHAAVEYLEVFLGLFGREGSVHILLELTALLPSTVHATAFADALCLKWGLASLPIVEAAPLPEGRLRHLTSCTCKSPPPRQ